MVSTISAVITVLVSGPTTAADLVIAAGVLVCLLARPLTRWVRWPRATAAAGLLLAATALVVAVLTHPSRWQDGLLAGAVLLAAVLGLRPPRATTSQRRGPGRRWLPARTSLLSMTGAALVVLLTAAGVLASWALPPLQLPTPTGPFPVAVQRVEWNDPTRGALGERVGRPAPRGQQRLVVATAFYPTTSSAGPTAPYLGQPAEAAAVTSALASLYGVPPLSLDALARGRTHLLHDTPITDGRHPVALFSPGLGGVRALGTAWASELASRGWVVLALDHPYDSAAVVTSDGQVITSRVDATGDDATDERLSQQWTEVRAEDLRSALDELATASPLATHVDLSRVAVAGHSLGGAAAIAAARRDPRIDAVVDVDGFPHATPSPAGGAADRTPLRQPVLALVSDARVAALDPEYLPALNVVLGESTDGREVAVPGSAHLSFTDAALVLPPLPSLVGTRPRAEIPQRAAVVSADFLQEVVLD